MTSSALLSIVTFVYGLSAFLYMAAWIFKKELPAKWATWTTAVAMTGTGAGILMRWVESYRLGIGHAPMANLYESLVFFAFTISLIYLVIERRQKSRLIGAFVLPIAFLAMAYASLSPTVTDRIQPLIPALKSNWLIAHVMACFVGYGAFAVAFGVSLMYLLRKGREQDAAGVSIWDFIKPVALFASVTLLGRILQLHNWSVSALIGIGVCFVVYASSYLYRRLDPNLREQLLSRLPEPKVLDRLTHQLIMFGFLFLSTGIITGAVWANSAWGRYWGWDPKETWSLITWFIYAALLHARMMRGWHGRRIAYLSIIGFMAVLFTYFGVNLLPGLHSYGAMGQ
jgi:cytochrome c-type biogenesis protein CcsB